MYSAIWTYKCKTPYPLLPPPERLAEYKEYVKQKLREKNIFDIEIEHSIQSGSVKVYFTPYKIGVEAIDLATLIALLTAIAGVLKGMAYLIASIRAKNPEFYAYTYDHKFSDNVPPDLWEKWEKLTGEKRPGQGFDFEQFLKDYWWLILIILLILLMK